MGPIEDLLHNLDTGNLNSGTNVEDEDSCPSDCESGISGTETEHQLIQPFDNGLIRICEGDMIHEVIKKKLVSSLSSCGYNNAQVEAIHRNNFLNVMTRAKLQTFCIYAKAMEAKYGGNANVKYAWYGASKDELRGILSHGFGFRMNDPTHGQGVYLSPVDCPLQSVQLASSDEEGRKHMLLCRVIMGKTELIAPGSRQYNPSSEEVDSGVDDLESPGKYIIWSSSMNTHILPEFVVSFRASSYCRGHERRSRPNSDWMPFPTLITTISKFLPPDAIELITKNHGDYRKQKITRSELIRLVRHIAGDKLLTTIIKSYRRKQPDRRK